MTHPFRDTMPEAPESGPSLKLGLRGSNRAPFLELVARLERLHPHALPLAEQCAADQGIPLDVMLSRRKYGEPARARERFWYLLRTGIIRPDGKPVSYPLIGYACGFDHSTVMHAVRSYQDRLDAQYPNPEAVNGR